MKLSNETKSILHNFRTINNSIVFAPGNVIRVVHKNKHSFGEAVIKEKFPKEFAIFDVKKFLDVLRTDNECELDFEDTQVKITQFKDGNYISNINYIYANKSHIVHNNTASTSIEELVTCHLSENNLSEIYRLSNILGLEDLVISGDSNIKIKLFDKTVNGLHDTFELDLGINGSEYIFDVYFKTINLNLMVGDYTIKIAKEKSEFTLDNNTIKYWIGNERDTIFKDK